MLDHLGGKWRATYRPEQACLYTPKLGFPLGTNHEASYLGPNIGMKTQKNTRFAWSLYDFVHLVPGRLGDVLAIRGCSRSLAVADPLCMDFKLDGSGTDKTHAGILRVSEDAQSFHNRWLNI